MNTHVGVSTVGFDVKFNFLASFCRWCYAVVIVREVNAPDWRVLPPDGAFAANIEPCDDAFAGPGFWDGARGSEPDGSVSGAPFHPLVSWLPFPGGCFGLVFVRLRREFDFEGFWV